MTPRTVVGAHPTWTSKPQLRFPIISISSVNYKRLTRLYAEVVLASASSLELKKEHPFLDGSNFEPGKFQMRQARNPPTYQLNLISQKYVIVLE
jgi:hypothetical protein